MSAGGPPITLAIVAGEESGDLLGADLARAVARHSGRPVRLVGVGGRHLRALGLEPLFDASDIAIMGLTAVLRDLPRLARRIGQTAQAIVRANPDCLVTIDSPAFNLRVAKRVRASDPTIPIVKYVCPSVWAWAPWRAAAMKPHTDHVLCLLPFEPAELERLGGPPGTFVGHRLLHEPHLLGARAAQESRTRDPARPTLLILPGSRRAEIRALAGPFGETAGVLARRGTPPRVVVPTLPHLRPILTEAVARWPVNAEIVDDEARKWQAFGEADAALAASGTVALELALAGTPLVSCYRNDPLVRLAAPWLINTWSASLPNLVADAMVVPELFDVMVRPERIARHLEAVIAEGPAREAQLEGFRRVREALATERPAGDIAAEIVLERIAGRAGL